MAATNEQVLRLAGAQRQQLEAYLAEFDQSWHEGRLAEQARALPPDSPLRGPALVEMVKIDLERQWQRGRQASLQDYLDAYPELGDTDSVPLDLIQTEYEVRRQFGAPAEAEDYARRFPGQAAAVRQALAGAAADETPPLPNRAEAATPPFVLMTPTDAQPRRASVSLPERFGRYRIIRRLGRGGMGSVFLAHDSQLDLQVALKVPHFTAEDSPEVLERFQREARAAAALHHPGLCRIYDVGQIDGLHYLTMAFIEGESMGERLRGGWRLSQQEASDLVRRLALAMAEAHRHGVIHRDLKPSNVMIDRRGEPVITDFGLAARADQDSTRLTQMGELLGTPTHMAPEQVSDSPQPPGPAVDVYGLGVILYELLTGHTPFEGTLFAVLAQLRTESVPPPSRHRPDLDPGLEAVCMKALAREPAGRYATMAELAEALDTWLKGGTAGRARRRLILAAGGVGLVLAAVLIGVGIQYWSVRAGSGPKQVPDVAPPPEVAGRPPKEGEGTGKEKGKAAETAGPVQAADLAVAGLIVALNDRSGGVRREAAETLKKLAALPTEALRKKAREAVPALMERVADDKWIESGVVENSDPVAGGKSAALDALRALAPDRVAEALVRALRAANGKMRAWAATELGRLRPGERPPGPKPGQGADPVVAALIERVADDKWIESGVAEYADPLAGGKGAALHALRTLAPDRVNEALLKALTSKNVNVRRWAATELGRPPPAGRTAPGPKSG
jgi:hypothetical protein